MEDVADYTQQLYAKPFGYARVRFENILFDHRWRPDYDSKDLELVEKTCKPLIKVFEAVRCENDSPDHILDALVETRGLEDKVAKSCEGTIPKLDHIVYALNGKDRIEAAKLHLPHEYHWWLVRLLPIKTNEKEIRRLREKYRHEKPPKDGHIFREIRINALGSDSLNEDKWWTFLPDTKSHNLNQLLKNTGFKKGFDKLVMYPGLWEPLQIGSLHRFLALKCNEVGDSVRRLITLNVFKGDMFIPWLDTQRVERYCWISIT